MQELRDYQIEDLATLIANPRHMQLSDPGTGKTPTSCYLSQYTVDYLKKGVVWVQPKSLLRKNRDELIRFTDIDPKQIIVVDGSPAERLDQLRADGKIWLMNFQRYSEDWEMLKGKTAAVIVDELHMGYSTDSSKRTQNLYAAMRHNEIFVPMTGTMIRGRLDAVYPSIHIIEPRYYTSHSAFMHYHAVKHPDTGKITGWKNIDKVAYIFAKHGIRRTFEECYGKKNYVIVTERCNMSEKQRSKYEEFEERAIIELSDERYLTASVQAVFALRCRQIMSIPHSLGLLSEKELSGKEEILQIHAHDHLNTGAPFVVFASMVDEQKRLAQLIQSWGISTRWMGGHTALNHRDEIDREFRAGGFQCLVASPEVAAFGFNWSHVDHILFTSLNYKDDSFSQAVMRAIRGKRPKPLFVSVLEYYDSIDQRIFEIVQRKSQLSNSIDSSYGLINLEENVFEHQN